VNNKVWRLLFTALLTTITSLLALQGAEVFLGYLKGQRFDVILSYTWVYPVYRVVFLISGLIIGFELGRTIFGRLEKQGDSLRQMSAKDKLAIGGGLIVGLVLSAVIAIPVFVALNNQKLAAFAITLLIGSVITYFCVSVTSSMKEEFQGLSSTSAGNNDDPAKADTVFVLDTNVIIDGRIADVARVGFVRGTMYVPGFVLDELQYIADSGDSLKRVRGRRGLDILNQMQKELPLVVRTMDKLAPGTEEVDKRLVRLTRALSGQLVTNDYNLQRVAELEGITVLSINALANALKPVVLPGEDMQVSLVREGRDHNQAVAYLDDGTMVVVEGARRLIGQSVDVTVSSLLQTTAGKMIFAFLKSDPVDEDNGTDTRGDSGSGPKRTPRERR
jgi:uncharacterized protein YacL